MGERRIQWKRLESKEKLKVKEDYIFETTTLSSRGKDYLGRTWLFPEHHLDSAGTSGFYSFLVPPEEWNPGPPPHRLQNPEEKIITLSSCLC